MTLIDLSISISNDVVAAGGHDLASLDIVQKTGASAAYDRPACISRMGRATTL